MYQARRDIYILDLSIWWAENYTYGYCVPKAAAEPA